MSHSESVIVVACDSIADGLGVAGRVRRPVVPATRPVWSPSHREELQREGQTILDSLALLPRIAACRPAWVIVSFGNFDAVIKPVSRAMQRVPPRWRAKRWLDPRPYFSRRPLKGLYQRVESAIRWRYRIALIRAFGGDPATSLPDFDRATRALVADVLVRIDAKLLLATPAGIDERFYPGANAPMSACASVFRAVAELQAETGRVAACDVAELLDRSTDFFADGFQPNHQGHRKPAVALGQMLER